MFKVAEELVGIGTDCNRDVSQGQRNVFGTGPGFRQNALDDELWNKAWDVEWWNVDLWSFERQ